VPNLQDLRLVGKGKDAAEDYLGEGRLLTFLFVHVLLYRAAEFHDTLKILAGLS
jgi:hypothetical protein